MQQIAVAGVQLEELNAGLERAPRRMHGKLDHGFDQARASISRGSRKAVRIGQRRGREHLPGAVIRVQAAACLPTDA